MNYRIGSNKLSLPHDIVLLSPGQIAGGWNWLGFVQHWRWHFLNLAPLVMTRWTRTAPEPGYRLQMPPNHLLLEMSCPER
jgi:hypothetical protein